MSCIEAELSDTDLSRPDRFALVYLLRGFLAGQACSPCDVVVSGDFGGDITLRRLDPSGAERPEWSYSFDGGFSLTDAGGQPAVAPDGSVYLPAQYTISTGAVNNTGGWLKKFAPSGVEDLSWDLRFNPTANNDSYSFVSVDSSGNVYVAGVEDGRTPSITNIAIGRFKKFAPDGSEITAGWNKIVDSAGRDLATSIVVAADGSVFVSLGRNVYNTATATENAWWTKRYASDGTEDLAWDAYFPNIYGNTEWTNTAYIIAPLANGDAYLCGHMNWSGTGFQQNYAWRVKRVGAGGVLHWTRELNVRTGVTGDLEIVYSCIAAPDGGVYAFGSLHATAGADNLNWALRKYDSAGNLDASCSRDWDSGFGADRAFRVVTDGTYLYLAGLWNTAGGQRGHVKRLNMDCSDDTAWPAPIFSTAGATGIALAQAN